MKVYSLILTIFLLWPLCQNAAAQIESAACYGIGDAWISEANRAIDYLEKRTNDYVSDQVSLLNFDIGNSKFGIQGTAGLGTLQAPPFNCSRPKEVLKSGLADVGISPSYILTARLFGLPVQVIDARLSGGQGRRTEVTPSPEGTRRNKLRLSVKVIGIDVLSKTTRAPETEIYDPMKTSPNPGQLPTSDKTGASGKLIDITRSISEALGGQQARVDIIPPILYVGIDAGFYLQSNIIFTYGVSSPFFNVGGNLSAKEIFNPAKASDAFCEDSPDSTSCTKKSSALEKKGGEFYQTLARNVTDPLYNIQNLKKQILEINTKKMIQDALLTRDALKDSWSLLNQSGLSPDERDQLIKNADLEVKLRPVSGATRQLQGIYEQSKNIQSSTTAAFDRIKTVSSFLRGDNGLSFPEVRGEAGMAFSGKVGGWASAMLVLDMALARGYAGIQGYLTLIDVQAGLGASFSTQSQYVDLNASLEQIRLMGGLDLVYGASIGYSPFETKYEGRKNLFAFPGSMSKKDWLAGRFDFRPPPQKKSLFWCWDVFGNAEVDQSRCNDGTIASSEINPSLAAHASFKKNFLNEESLNPESTCVVSANGKVLATLEGVSCQGHLPQSSDALLTGTDSSLHFLEALYQQDPSYFETNLRNSSNIPILVMKASSASQGSMKIYSGQGLLTEPSPVSSGSIISYAPLQSGPSRTISSIKMPNEDLNYFTPIDNPETEIISTPVYESVTESEGSPGQMLTAPVAPENFDAPLSERIYSLGSRPVPVKREGSLLTLGNAGDSDLQINMDFNEKFFVGDIPSLPNNVLVELGKKFMLGLCQVTSEGSHLFLNVSGKPYPFDGDPSGKVAANLNRENEKCFIGSNSGLDNPEEMYAACMLREAFSDQKCFPADRVVDLIRLANLSDDDALAMFVAPADSSDKKIFGSIQKDFAEIDVSASTKKVKITENKNTSPGYSNLFPSFFQGTGYGSPDYGTDAQRCNIPVETGSNHWFLREYSSNCLFCQASHALYVFSRPSNICYTVVGKNGARYPIGSNSCKGRSFKALYDYAAGTKADSLLCNTSDPGHRENVHATKLPALINSAAPGAGHGKELMTAIKKCMADGNCPYEVERGPASFGPELQTSSCQMVIAHGATKNYISGPENTLTLSGCIQEANSPSFSDAQAFCRDEKVKQILLAQVRNQNGSYQFSLDAKWTSLKNVDAINLATTRTEESRFIGKCFLTVSEGVISQVIGQNNGTVASSFSSTFSEQLSNCSLNVNVSGSSLTLKTAFKDDVLNPDSSSSNCWSSLGFSEGEGSALDNQSYANNLCKALPADIVIGLFAKDAPLLEALKTSSPTLKIPRTATFTISSSSTHTQACLLDYTVEEWKKKLNGGKCYLQLSALEEGGPLSQELPVLSNGILTGLAGCEEATSKYTCNKLRSLPLWLPYSMPLSNSSGRLVKAGAKVQAFYGKLPLDQTLTCEGTYDEEAEVVPLNNTCLAGLRLTSPVEQGIFLSLPLQSVERPTTSDSCSLTWKNQFLRNTLTGSSSNALFCAQFLSSVQKELIAKSIVSPPTVFSPVTYWSGENPLAKPIRVKAVTSYDQNAYKDLFDCEYVFKQIPVSSDGSGTQHWVLMSYAEAQSVTGTEEITDNPVVDPPDTSLVVDSAIPGDSKFGKPAEDGGLMFTLDVRLQHSSFLEKDVTKVVSDRNGNSFAALKGDGSVVSWGNYSQTFETISQNYKLRSGVVDLYTNGKAFVAIKKDGSVVTFGDKSAGGDSTSVQEKLQQGIIRAFSAPYAFAALMNDGSVVTWGNAYNNSGGNSSAVSSQLASGVKELTANPYKFSASAAFAALKNDGSVVTWGDTGTGGDSKSVSALISSGVSKVYANPYAFAALKNDGSVVTWGVPGSGGESNSELLQGVNAIYYNDRAFAALKNDGSVICWGDSAYGGGWNYNPANEGEVVTKIFSTNSAFAALKANGSVITWGSKVSGGDSSQVADRLAKSVISISSTEGTFAALKEGGAVVVWGDSGVGGYLTSNILIKISSDVKEIYSNPKAFAALKKDGSVITWGRGTWGGDSSAVAQKLLSGVKSIHPSQFAFAALKEDGSVVTWGDSYAGGAPSSLGLDSGVKKVLSSDRSMLALKTDGSVSVWGDPGYSYITETLREKLSSGVKDIYANINNFAVLKNDGSVVKWGTNSTLGASDVEAKLSSGVNKLFYARDSFAALKTDGSLVTWGGHKFGGDSSAVASSLMEGVVDVTASYYAYAALKKDGSVITWGDPAGGGDSTLVRDKLKSGVKKVYSTAQAFAALKEDGSVVTWGKADNGGDSTYASLKLTSGVKSILGGTNSFVALKDDGSVVTWGWYTASSSLVKSGVKSVITNQQAYAALKEDGSVVTWGLSSYGGYSSIVASEISSGVKAIFGTFGSFVAMKTDGTLVSWGLNCKPNDSKVYRDVMAADKAVVAEDMNGNIVPICGHSHSGHIGLNTSDYFLKTDGTMIYYMK